MIGPSKGHCKIKVYEASNAWVSDTSSDDGLEEKAAKRDHEIWPSPVLDEDIT